jgi:hypothetical protein
MPNASLTAVMNRAMFGPPKGLKPVDAPPPMPPAPPIELDYPRIAEQPEYKVEADKLNRFAKQKAEAEAKLVTLQDQLEQASKPAARTEEDAISKAESLLAGEAHGVNLQAEIQATNKLIQALGAAVLAQHGVVHRVSEQLSRAAGRRYEEEHKKRVKRLMAAVDELHAANRAEQMLREDLVRLGYSGTALPAMSHRGVEDPNAVCENITYYWYREAMNYSKSDEEMASEVRRARVKAMTAP